MNPYYYLFYKISRAINKKGNNNFGSVYAISVLIMLNFIFIYVKTFNITETNANGLYKILLGVVGIGLYGINNILFLNANRVKKIMDRYKEESEAKRKIGNCFVLIYVLLSVGLIVFF